VASTFDEFDNPSCQLAGSTEPGPRSEKFVKVKFNKFQLVVKVIKLRSQVKY